MHCKTNFRAFSHYTIKGAQELLWLQQASEYMPTTTLGVNNVAENTSETSHRDDCHSSWHIIGSIIISRRLVRKPLLRHAITIVTFTKRTH